ncbi:PET127-like protein [Trichoderma sp. SZMC 28014]
MIQPFLRARPLAQRVTLWTLRQPQSSIKTSLKPFTTTQVVDGKAGRSRARAKRRQSSSKTRTRKESSEKPKSKKPIKNKQPSPAEPGKFALNENGAPKDNGESHNAVIPPSAGLWTSLKSRLQTSNPSSSPRRRPENDVEDIEHEQDIEDDLIARLAEEPAAPEKLPPGKTSLAKKLAKGKKAKSKPNLDVKTIRPQLLKLCPVEEDALLPVPQLSHNLDRVLFNPGVYHMQDDRSQVFNFDPYLASIMPVKEFDFDALRSYVTSSKDVKLRQLSAAHGMKYCGSTSSMTSILSHFHYLLSAWRKPNFSYLSRSLEPESYNFTAISRGPAAAFAHFNDGVYAFDSDKEYDTENILSSLGKSMEKLLTLPKEEFEKYRRSRSHQLTEEERNAEDSFHYTTLGDFMMRSQLDAYDPRLPGSGMFDLKTRAVVAVRMDVRGYEKGAGYEIQNRFGQWESFEREYYDMIRTVFLKYSLQVRMGRMDGIFVAYHNTQRIFGFQYISLDEMDVALHGTNDRRVGDQEFKISVTLLNELMNRATKRFPGRTLRLHVETRPTKVPLTYFFVEPVTEEEMTRTQEAAKSTVEELERAINKAEEGSEDTGESAQAESSLPFHEEAEQLSNNPSYQDAQNEAAWNDMMIKVEETVEDDSLGIGSVREAVQEALEQSGILKDKTELEIEQYLDAMVASLTAHSSKIKELRDRSDDPGDVAGSLRKHDTQDGLGADEPSDGERRESSEFNFDTPDSEMQKASLTDLILKATEGIDNKAQNLKTFQKMFADLTTRTEEDDEEAIEDEQAVIAKDETSNEDEFVEEKEEEEGDESEAAENTESSGRPQRELFGMIVTVLNQVNGEHVERPTNVRKEDDFDWSVQYNITELPDAKAPTIYAKIKQRRKKVLAPTRSENWDWYKMFQGKLPALSKKGEIFREMRTQQEADRPMHVAWEREAVSREKFQPTEK